MSNLIVFGTNDLSEVLYESIEINKYKVNQKVIAFSVDDDYWNQQEFCDKHVYRYSELKKEFSCDEVEILVSVGYSNMNQNRKKIYQRILQDGWKIASYIDPYSIIRSDMIGKGNIIMDGVNIGIGCQIGDGNIFFSTSTLAHHSKVGDFNFFALHSSIAGRTKIGNNCFFGNNCCTRNHISIADKTLVGAGCYLDSDVISSGEVFVPQKCTKLSKSSMQLKF